MPLFARTEAARPPGDALDLQLDAPVLRRYAESLDGEAITAQRDYVDLGEAVYEQVPMLRWIHARVHARIRARF